MNPSADADPYAEFCVGAVEFAELEIARDGLARAIGREPTDVDVLIWLRARRALGAAFTRPDGAHRRCALCGQRTDSHRRTND